MLSPIYILENFVWPLGLLPSYLLNPVRALHSQPEATENIFKGIQKTLQTSPKLLDQYQRRQCRVDPSC